MRLLNYKADTILDYTGAKNEATGAYLNAATVTVKLYETDGVTQITPTITLTYVAASNGNYRGTVEQDHSSVQTRNKKVLLLWELVEGGVHDRRMELGKVVERGREGG